MGKNLSSRQNESLCEYEKMRMKILQSNAAKMKAKGYGTLANKILQEKYDKVARVVADEVTGEDMDFQYEVSKNVSSSRAKKAKQPFTQTLPMVEFIASKTKDRQQKNKEGQQYKPPLFVQESDSVMSGSMSRFMNMRKLHGSRGQQSNDVNLHNINANSSLADEQCTPQQPTDVSDVDVSGDATHNRVQVANALDETVQNENSVTKEKKHRGRTILEKIHARTMDKRVLVLFNDLDQSVGPTKEIVAENTCLSREKNWEYVQKKFILEEHAKKYVMRNVNEKWRVYKTRMKEMYYKENETMEQRLAKRPDHIPENEFTDLMYFWDSSKKNKVNRGKQGDMHTMGPVSYVMLREGMRQNDPNNQVPSQADIYIESRKRKPGRTYLTSNEETLENIEKMKEVNTSEDESNKTDLYYDVITKKEHSGCLRMYGLGVTKSSLKSKDPNTPYKIPSVFLDSITQQMKKTITEQVEQKLSYLISKIREANPGRDFVIPDFPTSQ